jgi:hypothetical protein
MSQYVLVMNPEAEIGAVDEYVFEDVRVFVFCRYFECR